MIGARFMSQPWLMVYESATRTILWSEGHNTDGLAIKPKITGGGLYTATPTDAVLVGAGFGLRLVEVAATEFMIMVPSGVPQLTMTLNVKSAEAPTGRESAVQITWPALPTS